MNLTTKERYLLEDQKQHEETCIQKYASYANMASDQQLKNLFNQNGQIEQQHLNSINQLLSGQIPDTGNQQGGQQQSQQPQENFTPKNDTQNTMKNDKELCTDMLMTEKYVSGTYDTAIFEFKDPQVRNVLNHIQKEEQQHGEAIFNYMNSNGMYSVQ